MVKSVACDECGRRFSRQQDLNRHVCTKPVTETASQCTHFTQNKGQFNTESGNKGKKQLDSFKGKRDAKEINPSLHLEVTNFSDRADCLE